MDIIVTADLYYAVAAVLSDLALKLVGQHPEIAEAVSTHFTMRRRGRITDAVTEEAVAAFVRDFGTAVGADARVAWLLPLGLLTIITEGNAYEYANDRLEEYEETLPLSEGLPPRAPMTLLEGARAWKDLASESTERDRARSWRLTIEQSIDDFCAEQTIAALPSPLPPFLRAPELHCIRVVACRTHAMALAARWPRLNVPVALWNFRIRKYDVLDIGIRRGAHDHRENPACLINVEFATDGSRMDVVLARLIPTDLAEWAKRDRPRPLLAFRYMVPVQVVHRPAKKPTELPRFAVSNIPMRDVVVRVIDDPEVPVEQDPVLEAAVAVVGPPEVVPIKVGRPPRATAPPPVAAKHVAPPAAADVPAPAV